MPDKRIRISCPECRTRYRIDPDAIPDQDASATCKECGRRFTIRRTPSGEMETGIWNSPVEKEQPDPLPFKCPSCGHRQSQPFNCYQCGAVITPKEPSSTVNVPPVSAEDPNADNPRKMLNRVMGEIIIRTRFKTSNWFLHLAKPRVSIDGMKHFEEWGAHAYQSPFGVCVVAVDCIILGMSCGRNTIQIDLIQLEKIYVEYYVEYLSAPGQLRKASLAEGLLWMIQTGTERPAGKKNTSRKSVITGLFLLGPLGLIKLWKNDRFSTTVKIVISAVVVLITMWLISKISMPMGDLTRLLGG